MKLEEQDLRPLDRQFGYALQRWCAPALDEAGRALLGQLGARLTAELSRQNVCLELDALAAEAGWPSAERLRELLHDSGLLASAAASGPLVLAANRLYLARYHAYESALARALMARACEPLLDASACDRLAPRLAQLFPETDEPGWQRLAAAMALDRRLTVIAGGPGTGKTTTVTRLLALCLEEAGPAARLRIRLAAPTGKAAARLTESLRQERARLAEQELVAPEVLAALPEAASTLHRLLGYRGATKRFLHDAESPLPVDVVVVDEASMVDLQLMAQLVTALPEAARLILLGDPDQLSSVEAGCVLSDLCAWVETRRTSDYFTREGARRLGHLVGSDLQRLAGDQVPALADTLCRLQHSHRFDAGSALGRFARAINEGNATAADQLLAAPEPGVGVLEDKDRLIDAAVAGYVEAVGSVSLAEAGAALKAFSRFQVLCASRHGPLGALAMNDTIERALRQRGLLAGGDTDFTGRLVMVTVNDYELGLFNGDLGLILQDETGVAYAWFEGPKGLRSVRATRLPEHETAFAMTVHKSQGSEFERVLVVLGEDSRLLTRELLYTAVTRARREVLLFPSVAAVRQAISTRGERHSGLRACLWPGF